MMGRMEIKVGCCGFPVGKSRYYRNFRLVEVNTTFYKYPRLTLMEKWRREAPEDFEFTVKANREITHLNKMDPEKSTRAIDKVVEICKKLRTRIVLLQTPASYKPSLPNIEKVGKILGIFIEKGIQPVYESRGEDWYKNEAPRLLRMKLKELDVPHVVDPLKYRPVYVGEVGYFRLHGLGKRMYRYDYSPEEHNEILRAIKNMNLKTAYILFNNIYMYSDALEFLDILQK
ncbi:hypothetical protein B6U74_01980 [Candidatus Bathyarchaeota archaeon ex4484_205]|nr:MAG: hypothetical protein B6U74_01980 [Candidatus Bathyarchaeota archaeon ex4484_205]RLG68315.1 MAG: DUF72 domain-containing protein [archaeon]